MDTESLTAIWLTLRLATTATLLLLLICTPLALWLANTRSRWRGVVSALTSLPLVLPPTVLGFYLLVAMGPKGPIGALTEFFGIGLLPFTFGGLVIGSMLYSLPFVVQPIQNAIEGLGRRPLEVAATLGASPVRCFFSVLLPQARSGFIAATVLGFAHTVGEFGVILMIGGNIPDETRVVSIQIYDYVELMNYHQAHALSAGMLIFSFLVLFTLYSLQPTGGFMRTTKRSANRAER
ncbi:MAG: molybdate ABC transporter permease subunit [Parahaliea sp.]